MIDLEMVAILIAPEEKSDFEGPSVNSWRRRGRRGTKEGQRKGKKKKNVFYLRA